MTYYTPSGNPTAETRGSSSQVRAEFQSIANGFTQVAGDFSTRDAAIATKGAINGQTWTGNHNFPATTYGVTAAVGSSGTAYATLDYVNTVSFNASLPAQAGKTDYLISTNGTAAGWANTVNVSVVKFVDGTDKSKQVQMDASALSTATTRKAYMPNRDVMLGGFSNIIVLTSTQTWTAPSWCTCAEVTVQDGGTGGQYNSGGSSTQYYRGGKGGNAGVSLLTTIQPNGSYTATIGAGSAIAVSPSAGGASSFSGPGITTLTSSNATLKVPGGAGVTWDGDGAGPGGGSLLAPAGSTGYGAGGTGGNNSAASGTAGQNGVVIIRY